MAYYQVTSLDGKDCTLVNLTLQPGQSSTTASGNLITIGNTPTAIETDDLSEQVKEWSLPTGLKCVNRKHYNSKLISFSAYINNVDVFGASGLNSSYTAAPSDFVFCIDDDLELGFIAYVVYVRSRTTYYWSTQATNEFYQCIKGAMVSAITSNGGGATHIAKRAGLLSSIGASNLSDILMVSGGGGGGLIIGEDIYAGKDAGGISGSGNNSANQTTGYAFGQGESADGVSGGGGGLYGGYKGGT